MKSSSETPRSIGFVTQHLDLSVGFGTYARELLRALAVRFPAVELRVYVPRAPTDLTLPAGVEIVTIPTEYRRSRLIWWKHVTAARRARRDGVDLIHYLDPSAPLGVHHPPTVMSLLDAIPWAMPQYRLDRYQDVILRRDVRVVDHILTISTHARDELSRLLQVDTSRITVTLLGCEIPEVSTWNPDHAAPYWLCFGGTEIRKNVEAAIRALDLVATFGGSEGARLKIVGPNEPSRTYRRCEELMSGIPANTQARVDWLGTVSDDELERLFAGASAVVFPSRYEGFGLPVLEAMARGIPVVAARTTSIPEVGRNAAVLVSADDAHGFAEAMARIVNNPVYGQELSHRGRSVARGFSWQRTAEDTMAAYVRVIRSAYRGHRSVT